MNDTPPPPSLPDLYRSALEEYRFQVGLNWDRTKFFILLKGTVLAAAAALLQLGGSATSRLLVVLLFLAGASVAWLGIRATREGKVHHRAAVAKKTLLESEMGLTRALPVRKGDHAILALGALASRSRAERILADVDAYVTDEVRDGSITGAVVTLLGVMLALDVAGALLVANGLLDCPLTLVPCDAAATTAVPVAVPR